MLISFVIRGELHYSVWEEEADDMNMPDITDVPFIRSNSKERVFKTLLSVQSPTKRVKTSG
jgi:hypothetical protein